MLNPEQLITPRPSGKHPFYVVSKILTTRIREIWADDEAQALSHYARGWNGEPVANHPDETEQTIECIKMVALPNEEPR
jgi:hypothetical protein